MNFLNKKHGVNYSMRTLKRRLKIYGLKKTQNVNNAELTGITQREIEGPSSRLGYRGMQGLLKSKYAIRCPRDTIMKKLKELDPEATEQRKSRVLKRREYISQGPNDTWHADGYDKLKPYGLNIHGAIDGFSRKVLWLQVCKSNNNPVIPASFYLKTIKELNLCPRSFRRCRHRKCNSSSSSLHYSTRS